NSGLQELRPVVSSSKKAGFPKLHRATTPAAMPQSPHIESVSPQEEMSLRSRKLGREPIARGRALPSTTRQTQCGAGSIATHDRLHRAGLKYGEREAH